MSALTKVKRYCQIVTEEKERQKLEDAIVIALVGDDELGSEGYRLKATKKLVRTVNRKELS